ncbi:glycosyltransferase 61 family protein [Aureimonas sp. AU22]|uniref:glycosyltransferase 61 family protein n=1 Tax=Aureimonas sp. AU22 TaxID=1638162 RepID=UPI0009E74D6F|nr:glycosyltransferase family 61 protein [Aureimonas sp. AU22]
MSKDVAYTCLLDAKVQAYLYPIVDAPVGFRGGPVLTDVSQQHFRHLRHDSPYDHFQADAEYPARLPGDYYYAGPIYDHFGHFLSEMVHRIVPAHAHGGKHKFLFVSSDKTATPPDLQSAAPYIRDILEFLGIDADNSVVIRVNSIVERLHVFEQGASWGGAPKDAYLDELSRFSSARLDELCGQIKRPKKIYVSRSALPKVGAILGEAYLETVLADEGFEVFRPEQHSFAVQMDHYRKAETIVFAEGSAAHGAELLGSRMMGSVVLVPRSQQAYVFERVLRPRSRQFLRANVTRYLGTVKENSSDGSPLFHRGVTLLRPKIAVETFRTNSVSPMRAFSKVGYLKSAVTDLRTYFKDAACLPEPFNCRYAVALATRLAFGWIGRERVRSKTQKVRGKTKSGWPSRPR